MKKRVSVRKLPAIIAAAGLLVSLSACVSSAQGPFAGCAPTGNSALVSADGAIGSDPEATFPTPIVAKKADLTVLEAGDGHQVTASDGILATISLYDGATGNPINTQQGPLTAVPLRTFVTNGLFPLTAGFSCATVGSRVVTAGTASQLFGADALGLDEDTALIVVTDIDSAFAGQANGADQIPQAGFPAVVFTPIGQPGFTFTGDTPTKLSIAALKQGSGETVEDGDTITANLTGIVWDGDTPFASSWASRAPAPLAATALTSAGVGVAPGLAKALIGQQVGSRLMVVIPPGDDSYPATALPQGVTESDTLVFVVDILAIG